MTIDGDQVASNYGLVDADYVNNRASNVNFTSNLANYLGSQCSNNSSFVSAMTNMNSNFMTNVKNNLSSDSGFLQELQGNFYNKNDINKKIKYELINNVTLDNDSSCVPLLPSSQAGQYDDLLLIANAQANNAANDKTFIAQVEIDNNYTNYPLNSGFDQTCYLELERKTENLWEVDTQIGVNSSAKHLFAELGTAFEYNNKVTALNLRPNGSTSQSFKAGSKFVLYGKKKF